MGLITWLLTGAIVGFFAGIISGKGSKAIDMVLGVVGGGLGGWLATVFGIGTIGAFAWANLLIALATSAIVLALWKALQKA